MADVVHAMFSMRCRVEIAIRAPASIVWAKLTNAEQFPSWNSTVTSIVGPISKGTKLAMQVPAAPGRTFFSTVTEFEPERRMVWADGFYPMFRGVRTYDLSTRDGSTTFAMEEIFEGLMLPMIKGSLPDFGPIFDVYAADLKRACEAA